MLKKNFEFFLLLTFFISGCTSNSDKVSGLGVFIIILFVFFWAGSIFLPKVQESRIIKETIEKCKKQIIIFSNLAMAICSILAVLSSIFFEGVHLLISGVFGIAIVGLFYIKKWAINSSQTNNKVELKIALGSVTFIIALLWIIFSGTKILRL